MKFKLNLLFLVVLFLFSLTGLFFKATLSFIVVLMHELAHAIVAKSLAVQVRAIERLPFGGVGSFRVLIEFNPPSKYMIETNKHL